MPSFKHATIKQLLSALEDIGAVDPHVAFTLLHICGSFCKFVHLARTTPPSLTTNAFEVFDADVYRCFVLQWIHLIVLGTRLS